MTEFVPSSIGKGSKIHQDCRTFKLVVKINMISELSKSKRGSHIEILGRLKYTAYPYLQVEDSQYITFKSDEKKSLIQVPSRKYTS